MKKIPPALDAITDVVLAYKPKLKTKAAKRRKRATTYWEVWQGETLVCSREMKLSKAQAMAKVTNEARAGIQMEARAAK